MIIDYYSMDRILSRLTKDDLLTYLKNHQNVDKLGKVALINVIKEKMNDDLKKEIMSHAKLYIGPTDVETILSIKRSVRKRWQNDGRLDVKEWLDISKYGKVIKVPRFSLWEIYSLNEDIMEQWSLKDEEAKKVVRKMASEKAKVTSQVNKQLRDEADLKHKQILSSIDDDCAREVYDLAHWTLWISRWAKVYQKRMKTGQKKYFDRYERLKEELYEKKNEAMKVMVSTDMCKISFYRPDYHEKESFDLCDFHLDVMREIRREMYGGYNAYSFFLENKDGIKSCDKCYYECHEDYYSLYYLELSSSLFESKFGFHIPYDLGKEFLPDYNSVERVEHIESEGVFRFGRVLSGNEKIIYREKDVLKAFDIAIGKFKN